jgi:hypothetical protein
MARKRREVKEDSFRLAFENLPFYFGKIGPF